MNQPKITVVIPTRERCDVLAKTLHTVVAQDYDHLEIIVSDNFSTDRTRETVEALRDPRMRYVNTGRRLSMSHNWEFALSHVNTGWLTVLGDDDGLLPNALVKVAELIRSNQVQAIRSSVCGYGWPSAGDSSFGSLSVPLASGIELRNSSEWLAKVLHGRASYTDLPMLYNGGFVSHDVVERIRNATGTFYRSSIPDVYSAVAIASVTQRYAFSHEPLAINGASRHSTGTAYFSSRPKAQSCSADLFHSEGIIPVHSDLPVSDAGRFPRSLQAMVFESYLQSADLRPPDEKVRHAEQLELVLSANVQNDPEIETWGRQFAQLHGLDYAGIERMSARTRGRLRFAAAGRNFVNEVHTFHCGSRELPLHDVYEASIAAASIRQLRTGRPSWLGVVARRLAAKLRTRTRRLGAQIP